MQAAVDLHGKSGALGVSILDVLRGRTGIARADARLVLLIHPVGVDVQIVAAERGVGDDVLVERQHGANTLDTHLGQGSLGAAQGDLAIWTLDDQLGHQGIVEAGDGGAGTHARVHADARTRRNLELGDSAGGGDESIGGIFRVDAELEGVAVADWVLVEAQRQAGGDAELLADDVHTRHSLGDRVLDLHAGVDLQEADGAVLGDDELHRARARVVRSLADGAGALDDVGALLIRQERRRGLLDELLEAALHGAVARAHNAHVAVRIGQHLCLHVAGLGQELLHVTLATTEGCLGLTTCGLEGGLDVVVIVHDLQTTATAAECGLDGDGHAVLVGEIAGLLPVRDRIRGAGRQRGANLGGQGASSDFVAQGLDGLRCRADPGQASLRDSAREIRILGQEAVAGVHAVRAGA